MQIGTAKIILPLTGGNLVSVLYLYKSKNKMKYIQLIIIASLAFTSCSTPEKAEVEVIKIDSKATLELFNQYF